MTKRSRKPKRSAADKRQAAAAHNAARDASAPPPLRYVPSPEIAAKMYATACRARVEAIRIRVAALLYDAGSWLADPHMGTVWGGPNGMADGRICDLRGWGHLTGGGALNLAPEKAAAVQDARKDFIGHSRADVAWLLQRHDAAEAEIVRLRTGCDAVQEKFAAAAGVHRCLRCGEAMEFATDLAAWRRLDDKWQHRCPEADPQAGHFDAKFFEGAMARTVAAAHQDGYAEGRKHRVAAAETHADEMHRAQAEIDKLKAEVEEWKGNWRSVAETASEKIAVERKESVEVDRLVRLARRWLDPHAPADVVKVLDDYVFVHSMTPAMTIGIDHGDPKGDKTVATEIPTPIRVDPEATDGIVVDLAIKDIPTTFVHPNTDALLLAVRERRLRGTRFAGLEITFDRRVAVVWLRLGNRTAKIDASEPSVFLSLETDLPKQGEGHRTARMRLHGFKIDDGVAHAFDFVEGK